MILSGDRITYLRYRNAIPFNLVDNTFYAQNSHNLRVKSTPGVAKLNPLIIINNEGVTSWLADSPLKFKGIDETWKDEVNVAPTPTTSNLLQTLP